MLRLIVILPSWVHVVADAGGTALALSARSRRSAARRCDGPAVLQRLRCGGRCWRMRGRRAVGALGLSSFSPPSLPVRTVRLRKTSLPAGPAIEGLARVVVGRGAATPIARLAAPVRLAGPLHLYGSGLVDRSAQSFATYAAAADDAILEQMKIFALKQQTSVSMRTLLDTGHGLKLDDLNLTDNEVCAAKGLTRHEHTLLQIATFLQRELPIRFAHRARELDNMPEGLYQMRSIQMVKHWYMESFADLQQFQFSGPVDDMEKEAAFRKCIHNIKERHADTNVAIAQGLMEFQEEVLTKKAFIQDLSDLTSVHEALGRFFMARIGIRMLMGQYLELNSTLGVDGQVGLINERCVPRLVAEDAAADACYMCERAYGFAPEVVFLGSNLNLSFPYVDSHLYYVLFELLKNSLRATVEFQVRSTPCACWLKICMRVDKHLICCGCR